MKNDSGWPQGGVQVTREMFYKAPNCSNRCCQVVARVALVTRYKCLASSQIPRVNQTLTCLLLLLAVTFTSIEGDNFFPSEEQVKFNNGNY